MTGRKSRMLAAALCAAMLLTGCRIGDTQIVWKTDKLNNHKYVFQVNDRTCDVKQAKLYLCNYRNLYGSAYGIDLWSYDYNASSLEQYVKDITIQELSRIVCMDMLAEQMGMSLTEEEQECCEQAASEYYASLSEEERSFMDVRERDIQKAYRDYALAKKLYRSLTENIDEEVSDDEARVIRVQQIYVTDADTAQLIKEKLTNGDDFAAVASTYNKASEVETVVARDEYPQEVENIAFNLDDGAISDMIEANGGYYFIKCLNKLEEQLTEDNKENIRQKRRMELFDHEYQDFIDQATFTMNDSLWDDIHLEETEEITTDSFFQIYDKCFKEE